MATEPKSILIVVFAALLLAATMLYSVKHPETGDDIYEGQAL